MSPCLPGPEASHMAVLLKMFSSVTGVRWHHLIYIYLITGELGWAFKKSVLPSPFSILQIVSFSIGVIRMASYERRDSFGGNPTSVFNLQTWLEFVSSVTTEIP